MDICSRYIRYSCFKTSVGKGLATKLHCGTIESLFLSARAHQNHQTQSGAQEQSQLVAICELLERCGMVASMTIHLDEAVENLALPLMEDYTTAPMYGGMQEENNFKYVGLLSVAFGMPPVARKAWRALRRSSTQIAWSWQPFTLVRWPCRNTIRRCSQ